MRKLVRFVLVTVLITGLIFAYFPVQVVATHSFYSGMFTIRVGGQTYEVWGYDGDGPVPAMRLRDLAYILRDTSARFDIRESNDPAVDYWIVLGETYTPDGTEHAAIEEYRWARFGSLGHFDWYGFDAYPVQAVVLGIDGEDAPLTSFVTWTVQDVDYTYFPVEIMSQLLGFTLRWVWDEGTIYEIITGTRPAAELPVQSPQLSRLLSQLNGQWVDEAHFNNPIIDETVIWSMELEFSFHGFTDIVNLSVAPVWTGDPIFPQLWYPLAIRELESGVIELTVPPGSLPRVSPRDASMWDDELDELPELDHNRFENQTILFDPELMELKYYVDDIPHTMIRRDWYHHAERYTVEAAEEGGVTLRYVISGGLDNIRQEIWVFRSTQEGEQGTNPIYRRLIADPRDILLWQFTDTDVEHDHVYYYTLILKTNWGDRNISPNRQQMRVDINMVLGEPEQIAIPALVPVPATSPTPVPEIYKPTTANPWSIAGNIIASALGLGGIAWLVRKIRS